MNIEDVRQILRNVPESQKKTVERLITGEVSQQVICGGCGRVVAEVLKDGKVEPTIDAVGKMWLLAFRYRLDGYMGFQCLCGNDSRLCTQEKGVKGIEKNNATKKDIELVLGRVQAAPPNYPKVKGKQIIDKFTISDVL